MLFCKNSQFVLGEDIEWNDVEDKHLVGGVLMAFLLRLPVPLITFKAYEKLIDITSSGRNFIYCYHIIFY